ncbi:hypothetical protein GCM10022225_37210 [Plantactinospora mayteni]|uniref:Uncharacterized protein n=1 Tax=Plantactinospora mayteni TaxID=566021 RepID=A0ABQ4EKM2_9ACTN|nr:hypothetical protein [Plantactinospora mayteni]GIG95301.1 hypothetical protein Pma05_18740 [Plantactinospora mayteni]
MTVLQSGGSEPAATAGSGRPRREVIGAWFLLAGYLSLLLGLTWDGQWHNDVGPDNFWTAPHLLLYSGTAIMGLTCLTVVLVNTWRPGLDGDRPAVRVFGVFRAPLPFLVGGVGAAGNLLYGVADLWWHDFYGFDIALASTPSHLGLALCIFTELVGVVMAATVLGPSRGQRWAFAAACAVGVMGSTQLANVLSDPVSRVFPALGPRTVLMGVASALVVCLAVGVTRSVRWLLASGLVFLTTQVGIILFTPAATRWYADAIDMPFRDYAAGISPGIFLPAAYPVVMLLVAAVLWYARRRAAAPTRVVPVLGVVAGLLTALMYAFLESGLNRPVTLLVTALLSGATGWFGWRCAALVRGRELAAPGRTGPAGLALDGAPA